jgi:hypothetical protein
VINLIGVVLEFCKKARIPDSAKNYPPQQIQGAARKGAKDTLEEAVRIRDVAARVCVRSHKESAFPNAPAG